MITVIVEKCCGSAPIAEPDVVGGSIRALRVDSVTASTFISRATGLRWRASTSERLNCSTTSLSSGNRLDFRKARDSSRRLMYSAWYRNSSINETVLTATLLRSMFEIRVSTRSPPYTR